MDGRKIIDIQSWNRREHYEFFSSFEDPMFGLSTELDCTHAYYKCKSLGIPVYHYYLYLSLKAANAVENFRLRIENDLVVSYEVIHASATEIRHDHSFGFTYLPYSENFEDFSSAITAQKIHIENTTGLNLRSDTSRSNLIHYTTLPWVSFKTISHARFSPKSDSIPKIAFGKFVDQHTSRFLPVAVHAHHGLMDGWHVGQFFQIFQELLKA